MSNPHQTHILEAAARHSLSPGLEDRLRWCVSHQQGNGQRSLTRSACHGGLTLGYGGSSEIYEVDADLAGAKKSPKISSSSEESTQRSSAHASGAETVWDELGASTSPFLKCMKSKHNTDGRRTEHFVPASPRRSNIRLETQASTPRLKKSMIISH